MLCDVPKVIANLGGSRLYGNRPELALRELIQHGTDAVRALRTLDGIDEKEGHIEVALARDGDFTWLHLTDTGIGMSRYVLTEVLLDFGNSLWRSESLRAELPGLASRGFKAVGCFGIGFFSVFMLGREVIVTTRRFSRSSGDNSDQWSLEFRSGLVGRPTLRRPISKELLHRSGTRVSVALDHGTLERLQNAKFDPFYETTGFSYDELFDGEESRNVKGEIKVRHFREVVANLCPTLDVEVLVKIGQKDPLAVVIPNDWHNVKPERLMNRLYKSLDYMPTQKANRLIDLRETSGILLGRIGYVGGSCHAIITHGGIRNGSVPKLAGVLLGHNNYDLARSESRPLASREAWQQWAEAWIDSASNHTTDALADLHRLCPFRDLSVYRIGSEQLNEAQLSDWLQKQSEVLVLPGVPEHEDSDDVSREKFDNDLELNADFLFLPSTNAEIAKSLALPSIDYKKRLEQVLKRVWGEFEEWEDDDVSVGDVGGVDIIRTVSRYVKVEAN
jgi:hypothetical protein